MVPANMDDALKMLDAALGMQQCVLGSLAAQDAASLPAGAAADQLRALERNDAIEAALRGRLLAAFDARDRHLADGQRTTRAWLVHSLRVTKGQAGQHQAVQALARSHQICTRCWPRAGYSPSPRPCNWPSGPGPSRRITGPRPRRSWSPPPGQG